MVGCACQGRGVEEVRGVWARDKAKDNFLKLEERLQHGAFKGLGLCRILNLTEPFAGWLPPPRRAVVLEEAFSFGCQPSRVWQSLDALGEGARIGMHTPATHKQMQVIRIIRVQPRSLACSIHEWKLRPRLMHCKECTGNVLHFKQIKISAYFFNAC